MARARWTHGHGVGVRRPCWHPSAANVPSVHLPPSRQALGADYSGLISTLRNFTTPAPYCRAIGPLANLLSWVSTVVVPLRTTVICGPLAVISKVFHPPPALGIGSTLATSTIA